MPQLKLRSKLLVTFVLAGLLPLLALFAFLNATVFSELRGKSVQPLSMSAGPLQESIDRGLAERFGDALAFAAVAGRDFGQQGGIDRISEQMNERMAFYPIYKLMILADADGRIVAVASKDAAGRPISTASLIGGSVADTDWFRRARAGEGENWKTMSGAVVGRSGKIGMVASALGDDGFAVPFAATVRDESGKVTGVWANFLNPTFIDEIALSVGDRLGRRYGDSLEVTVFDSYGQVVTGYTQEEHAQKYARSDAQFENVLSFSKEFSATEANSEKYFAHDGGKVGGAFAVSDGDHGEPKTGWRTAIVASDDQLQAEVNGISRTTLIFTLLGGLATAVAGWFIGGGIARPILQIIARMRNLVAGDKSAAVPGIERGDDIGDIARAVENFREAALDKDRLESETAAERERSTAERERVAARQNLVVERLAEALGALSQGDLTHALPADFPEEYVRLRDDHAAAIGRLRETMQAIVQSAETIRTGTGEIAGASEDLARRTEAQAASLEQTAAALEETSGAVKTTATNSRDAASKVAGAKETAAESGTVAQQTIDAIARIQASQREIGSIVGVMQEIAYQTNILALNAGVEAARAGDAGRGFMVVANEVRLLAQRSSEAAKDIQRLIGSSNEQVDGGVTLVNRSADMLKRIVDDVMSVNELIADIASASERQAMGVNQISSAVNQMDSTTQQNAAMVEQTTAAARSLASETEALTAQIGFFRIGRTAQAYTPAAETRPARTQLRLASGGDFTPTTSNEDWNRF